MVLEAVMICVDNSSFMRNGDYVPTRLEAQNEAVNFLASMKTQSNPESTVGLLATAGKRVEVLLSLDRELGKIMNALRTIHPEGTADLTSSLKTAQLVLKNRQNKKQKQRIILFVGSPVVQDVKAMVKVAKNMKKNNVAVDIINFGYENSGNDNQAKLDSFITAVNSGDNSKLVNIPPGPHNLSDMIVSSIMSDGGVGAAGAAGGAAGAAGQFGGVDASVDPDLALALRMSMEEERERQQREAQKQENDDSPAAAVVAEDEQGMNISQDDDEEEDEDALLAEAIALSMAAEAAEAEGDVEMRDDDPEEEEAEQQQDSAKKQKTAEELQVDAALQDVDFYEDLIDSLPGVDKDDIDISELMDSVNQDPEDSSKDKKKDKKKDKDSDKS